MIELNDEQHQRLVELLQGLIISDIPLGGEGVRTELLNFYMILEGHDGKDFDGYKVPFWLEGAVRRNCAAGAKLKGIQLLRDHIGEDRISLLDAKKLVEKHFPSPLDQNKQTQP